MVTRAYSSGDWVSIAERTHPDGQPVTHSRLQAPIHYTCISLDSWKLEHPCRHEDNMQTLRSPRTLFLQRAPRRKIRSVYRCSEWLHWKAGWFQAVEATCRAALACTHRKLTNSCVKNDKRDLEGEVQTSASFSPLHSRPAYTQTPPIQRKVSAH